MTPYLEVADDATSVSVELSGDAAKAAYHKAFLVKKLETPECDTGIYNIVEYIRQGSSGNAWFVTDYYCTGKESISAVFEGIGDPSKSYRPFGFRCESSGEKQCVIDVYNNKMNGWGFTVINDDSSWKWVNPAKLTASTEKTELTFDLFNLKYTRTTAEDSVSHNILPEYTFFREGVEKSSVPLVIFGVNNNSPSGMSCIDGSVPNGGSLLYRCSIKTNDSAYARYYIPVSGPSTITTTTQPMGYLWEVVENKVIPRTTKEGSYNYQNSSFVPRDINNVNLPALDFHAVVPVELQAKYETVVSACNADRRIKEVSVERRSVTVSLTPGVSGGKDILYIAWGDSDKGDTLAAWGDNVYCAGEVADDATSVSVALPRGIYPNHFRAFLLKRSDINCDGFVEYLLSTGKSYIESDWLVEKGDKFSIRFSLGSSDSNQRLFGGHDGQPDTTCVELYLGNSTYRHAICKDGEIDFDSKKVPDIPLYTAEVAELYYDSANSEFSVSYIGLGKSYNYQFSEGTATAKSGTKMLIFGTSRQNWESRRMKEGAKFYSMTISNMVNSVATLARCYIPAKKVVDGVAVYGVWDGVGNKFLTPPVPFSSKTSEDAEFDSVPFSGANMPEDLKRRYLTVVDSATAYRKEAGLHITIR